MKPNTLFALLSGMLLGICITEIYLTSSHIIIGSSPLEKALSISLQSSNATDDDDVQVYNVTTDDDNVQTASITKVESHVAQTHYLENLNSNHTCFNQSLPLTQQSPRECWPYLTILPSHATSGSKLFQDIWELFGTSMSQYNEPPRKIDKLFSFDNLDVYGSLKTVPYGQPVVFKSHVSQSKKKPRRQEMKEMLHRIKKMGLLHGIIRMARNPGDQLIRNSFRWGSQDKYCKSHKSHYESEFDCFLQKSKRMCHKFSRTRGRWRDPAKYDSNTYTIFHNFWNTIDLGIPETTIHYERMTSKIDVIEAMKSIITFMGEHNPGYDADSMHALLDRKVDKVKAMVKEPEYEHGTLMARICGVKAATILHEKTREYSRALGYVFDFKSGHWSLKK